MATCHRGTGQPLEENPNPHEQDNNIPNEHHDKDIDNFENMENENHTTLKPSLENLIIYARELRLLKVNPQKP